MLVNYSHSVHHVCQIDMLLGHSNSARSHVRTASVQTPRINWIPPGRPDLEGENEYISIWGGSPMLLPKTQDKDGGWTCRQVTRQESITTVSQTAREEEYAILQSDVSSQTDPWLPRQD